MSAQNRDEIKEINTRKSLAELGLYNEVSYNTMQEFCFTVERIGLAPWGFSSFGFRHTASTHYASACFHFFSHIDFGFMHGKS